MRIKERYIPASATAVINGSAVVYTYEHNNKLLCIGYYGNRSKPDFHYSFKTRELRDDYIQKFFDAKKASENFKQKLKLDQKQAAEKMKVKLMPGTILVNSWGYEQTNVDFYQVIEVKGSMAIIRPIESRINSREGYSSMSGFALPVPDAFTGEPIKKRISSSGVRFDHGGCRIFEGKEEYVSWYA